MKLKRNLNLFVMQVLTEGKNKEAGHVLTVGAKDIATTVPFTSAGYYDVSALKTGGVGNLFGSRAGCVMRKMLIKEDRERQ